MTWIRWLKSVLIDVGQPNASGRVQFDANQAFMLGGDASES